MAQNYKIKRVFFLKKRRTHPSYSQVGTFFYNKVIVVVRDLNNNTVRVKLIVVFEKELVVPFSKKNFLVPVFYHKTFIQNALPF